MRQMTLDGGDVDIIVVEGSTQLQLLEDLPHPEQQPALVSEIDGSFYFQGRLEESMSTSVLERVLDYRGQTQQGLAKLMGISSAQLSRMLSGQRRWTPEQQENAARVLGIPVEILFSKEANTNTNETETKPVVQSQGLCPA